MSRTIFVGDIHGCLEEFDELLKQVDYRKGSDCLIPLGDLIDRGPDPAGVVRRCRELGATPVKGNHEETALRWRRHEALRREAAKDKVDYRNPMKAKSVERLAEWASIPDEDWDWIAKLPNYIKVVADSKQYIAVHAGVRPGTPIQYQDERELHRLRYMHRASGKMIPLTAGEVPPDGIMWNDLWKGPEIVMHGHHVYDKIQVRQHSVSLDTGCCFGGHLAAAIVHETWPVTEFSVVRAKKIYSDPRKAWGEGEFQR